MGFQIHYLKPGATFKTTEKVVAAFEYCNLHGLWKADT
jgi:superoxide reductase